jgi:hypothetical protein
MSTRVYVPASWREVRDDVAAHRASAGGDEPTDRRDAHAVTAALLEALPGSDDEELEHYAMTEAAQESLHRLVGEDGPRRRLVMVVETDDLDDLDERGEEHGVTSVRARVSVPRDVVAWLVDTGEAGPDVASAVEALERADPQAFEEAAERCLDHELAWFATTELDEVLALG